MLCYLGEGKPKIARLLLKMTFMLTYPIECFIVHEVPEDVVWLCMKLLTKRHHFIVVVSIAAKTFLVVTLIDCLGVVLELNVGMLISSIRNTK